MKKNIKACLEQHLVDKIKNPNVVPASAWLASAEQHHKSAQLIINHDAAGALQMAWSAMHDIAKAAAASAGLRLEAETHGKIADFLACVHGRPRGQGSRADPASAGWPQPEQLRRSQSRQQPDRRSRHKPRGEDDQDRDREPATAAQGGSGPRRIAVVLIPRRMAIPLAIHSARGPFRTTDAAGPVTPANREAPRALPLLNDR